MIDLKGFKKDGKFIPTEKKQGTSIKILEGRGRGRVMVDETMAHQLKKRKDESVDFEVDQTPIREYNKQKDTKSKVGWHKNINTIGTIAERSRNGNQSRAFAQEKHFTRCELKNGLMNCPEDREHLYASSLTHSDDMKKLDKGTEKHECVFCGDKWNKRTSGMFQETEPYNGTIVEDVPNNELVREEAKIRNIPLSHYEMDQESKDPEKFDRKAKEDIERSNYEYAHKYD